MPVLHYRDPADQQWKPINDVGPTGPTGPTGAAGVQGLAGPSGPSGPAGSPGAVGPTGPTGQTGNTGAQGPTGPKGAVGNTGSTGAVGPTGPVGYTGAQGAQGPQGLAGQPRGWVVQFGYTVVIPVANTPTSTRVNFSSRVGGNGTFTTTPQVLAAPNSSVPKTVLAHGVSAVDTAGCDLEIYRTNTTSTGMHWIALGW